MVKIKSVEYKNQSKIIMVVTEEYPNLSIPIVAAEHKDISAIKTEIKDVVKFHDDKKKLANDLKKIIGDVL